MLQKVNKFYQFLLTIIIFILHTLDEDYSFSPQNFLYLRKEPDDKDIDINIINDNVALEPIEVIEISLMVPNSAVLGQHTTTIIIRDEDSKNVAVMCLLIILCTPLLLSFSYNFSQF